MFQAVILLAIARTAKKAHMQSDHQGHWDDQVHYKEQGKNKDCTAFARQQATIHIWMVDLNLVLSSFS